MWKPHLQYVREWASLCSNKTVFTKTDTHFSILAWRIPWTEEPGRLQSVGSQESDTTERLSTHIHKNRRRARLGHWAVVCRSFEYTVYWSLCGLLCLDTAETHCTFSISIASIMIHFLFWQSSVTGFSFKWYFQEPLSSVFVSILRAVDHGLYLGAWFQLCRSKNLPVLLVERAGIWSSKMAPDKCWWSPRIREPKQIASSEWVYPQLGEHPPCSPCRMVLRIIIHSVSLYWAPASHCIFCLALEMYWASLVSQMVKNPPAMQESGLWSLGWEDPLEEGIATHSSIVAWIEEPGGL